MSQKSPNENSTEIQPNSETHSSETRKKYDFVLGFGLFFVMNFVLYRIRNQLLYTNFQNGHSPVNPFSNFILFLPFLINGSVIIFLGFKRPRMAGGMLVAILVSGLFLLWLSKMID